MMLTKANASNLKLKGLVLEGELPVFVAMIDTSRAYVLNEFSWADIDWDRGELVTKMMRSTYRDKILRVTPDDVDLSKHLAGSLTDLERFLNLARTTVGVCDYQAACTEILQAAIEPADSPEPEDAPR
jgi:hypothetical protein